MKQRMLLTTLIMILILCIGLTLIWNKQTDIYNELKSNILESSFKQIDNSLIHIKQLLNIVISYAIRDIEASEYITGIEQIFNVDSGGKLRSILPKAKDDDILISLLKENSRATENNRTSFYGFWFDSDDMRLKIVLSKFFEDKLFIVVDLNTYLINNLPEDSYIGLYSTIHSMSNESSGFKFLTPNQLENTNIDFQSLINGEKLIIEDREKVTEYRLEVLNEDNWLIPCYALKSASIEKTYINRMRLNINISILIFILAMFISFIVLFYKLFYSYVFRDLDSFNGAFTEKCSENTKFKLKEFDDLFRATAKIKKELSERNSFVAEMGYYDTITGVGNVYLLEKELALRFEKSAHIKIIQIQLKHEKSSFVNGDIQMFLSPIVAEIKTVYDVYRKSDFTFVALTEKDFIDLELNLLIDKLNKLIARDDIKLSAAVVCYPEHGTDVETLLENLEICQNTLFEKNIIYYMPEIKEDYLNKLKLEKELKMAISHNEIKVVYQPIVCPYTQKLMGVEALVRWNRKNGERISPDVFIPIAERIGIIDEIDKIVFEKSCHMLLLWEEIYEHEFFVSINTSPVWFMSDRFVPFVRKIISELNIDPRKICLEIIESCLIEDILRANQIILDVKEIGFKIALDDFGKGYSSLTYLRSLDIDKLKIDKDFLLEMDIENDEYSLIDSIVDMAHHMNYQIVVEGVERHEQLEYLKQLGVEFIQGYLFSKPLEKEEISQFLIKGGKF